MEWLKNLTNIPSKLAIITLVLWFLASVGSSAIDSYADKKVEAAVAEALKIQSIEHAKALGVVIELNDELTLQLIIKNKELNKLLGDIDAGVYNSVMTIISEGQSNGISNEVIIDDVSGVIIDGMWNIHREASGITP